MSNRCRMFGVTSSYATLTGVMRAIWQVIFHAPGRLCNHLMATLPLAPMAAILMTVLGFLTFTQCWFLISDEPQDRKLNKFFKKHRLWLLAGSVMILMIIGLILVLSLSPVLDPGTGCALNLAMLTRAR